MPKVGKGPPHDTPKQILNVRTAELFVRPKGGTMKHRTARTTRTGTKLGATATFLQRLAAHLSGEATPCSITMPDLAITSEATPGDIQRARDLIKEHGWTHLLRPDA